MKNKYNYETVVFDDFINNNISSWSFNIPTKNEFKSLPCVNDEFVPQSVKDFNSYYANKIAVLNNDLTAVSSLKEKEEIQKLINQLDQEKQGIDTYGSQYAYIQADNKYWDFYVDKFMDSDSIPKAEKGLSKKYAYKAYNDSEYKTVYKLFDFNPGGDREFYSGRNKVLTLNKWFGWGVKNIEYDANTYEKYIKPILYNIYYALCSGNDNQFIYLIKWLAHMVQKPNEKPGVAVLLKSERQGTGKGLFMNFISSLIYEDYYLYSSDVNSIVGSFNGHLDGKLFVFLDEAIWGGDKKDKGNILSIVTESKMYINNKHEKAHNVKSYLRIFAASNSEYPIDIPKSDRRWFVPDMDERIAQNESYFNKISEIYKNKTAKSVFLTFLSKVDLNGFSITAIPKSKARDALKVESINNTCAVDRFLCALAADYENVISEMESIEEYNELGVRKKNYTMSAGFKCFNCTFIIDYINKFYTNRKGLQSVSKIKVNNILGGSEDNTRVNSIGLKKKNLNGSSYWVIPSKDDLRKAVIEYAKLDSDFFDNYDAQEEESNEDIEAENQYLEKPEQNREDKQRARSNEEAAYNTIKYGGY